MKNQDEKLDLILEEIRLLRKALSRFNRGSLSNDKGVSGRISHTELEKALKTDNIALIKDKQGYFNTAGAMRLYDVAVLRLQRRAVYDALVRLYGIPDKRGRWRWRRAWE